MSIDLGLVPLTPETDHCARADIISLLGQSRLILYTLITNYYLDGHRLNYCDAIS
jgi:hypothetical protein